MKGPIAPLRTQIAKEKSKYRKAAKSVGGCPDLRNILAFAMEDLLGEVLCGRNVEVERRRGLLACVAASVAAAKLELPAALDADGTLLEVRFPADGVVRAERNEVGVLLGEVKGHEDLSWRNDAGDAELEVGN